MNKFFVATFCVLFLSACGSDSKPNGSGGNGGGAMSAGGGPCLELKGVFSRMESTNDEGRITERKIRLQLDTKVESGVYQYDFSGEGRFVPADNQVKDVESEGQKGKLQLSCDATSVTMTIQQEDQAPMTLKYVLLSGTQVRIESNSEESANLRGTYTKE